MALNQSLQPGGLRRSILPSVSPYESGVLGALPPAPAYQSGVLGAMRAPSWLQQVLRPRWTRRAPPALRPVRPQNGVGALPPAPAYQSGVLGVFGTPPPSGAFHSGSLGVLGTPPPSGAIKSGVLGSLGVPPPAGAVRSGSLGVFGEAFDGLGAGGSIMPVYQPIGFGDDAAAAGVVPKIAVAAAGLGAVAVIWWAMSRRHA